MATAPQKPAQPDAKDKSEPVLDFDAVAPNRETVRKGGKLYEIREMKDFGVAKQQALQRDGKEFSRLWDSDEELSENQQIRLKFLLERMFEDVLDAPKAAKARFADAEKSQVVLTFTLAPLKRMMAAQAAAELEQTEDKEARVSEPTSAT